MPIPFACAECGESYDIDDDMAGKTIRCRECHGFNRTEVPRKKLPPRTPVPATKTEPAPRKPADDGELRFRRRSVWPLLVSLSIHFLMIAVWAVCIGHTVLVLDRWAASDSYANGAPQQTVSGTYAIVRLVGGWVVAFSVYTILRVIQQIIDLGGK